MFSNLEQLVADAKVEQQEYQDSAAALTSAKAELSEAQTVVAGKQEIVAEASAAANKEKGDVVDKLSAIITECQNILTELQS